MVMLTFHRPKQLNINCIDVIINYSKMSLLTKYQQKSIKFHF